MFRNRSTLMLLLALSLTACRSDGGGDGNGGTDTDGPATATDSADSDAVDETGDDSDDSDDPDDPDPDPEEPAQAPSTRAGVKRKAPSAYARDLAASLEIPPGELCRELSSFDCVDTHLIALGGVEPYDLAVYEPLPEPGVSSPIAVDRIALSACGERWERDVANGSLELYAELMEGDTDPSARTAVAQRLIRRLLRRDGEPREIEAVVALWDDLPEPDARTWAQLSCFAIATTLENLFY